MAYLQLVSGDISSTTLTIELIPKYGNLDAFKIAVHKLKTTVHKLKATAHKTIKSVKITSLMFVSGINQCMCLDY